ncbi:MAG: 23S rRNA (adenine(2503)-C(2))-methyltransferase RlmN [Eubacteriales bacterium]
MTLSELKVELESMDLPQYRAEQLYAWFHQKGAKSYDEMSDLPKSLRNKFSTHFPILICNIVNKQTSKCDGTVKYLFQLNDGELIESVLMQYKYGYTLCVSTQVGCKMGCKFCATAIGGLVRNLRPSEILGQIHETQRDLNIRVSHVVLMGMGEPLDNFKNVMRFLDLVSDANGFNIGMRNISLSTCGIVPAINLLLEKHLQLTLSVSIHAPNDIIRSAIMPVNNKYNVDELLETCRNYTKQTSRRISFEYAMLDGINDSYECALELANKVKGILCHVNLIPTNEFAESRFNRSSIQKIENFKKTLLNNGINVTIRRSLGSDIDASCGQLRSRNI